MLAPAPASLSILHVMRAPVGGLFRHVVDLARGQHRLGHKVGIIADAATGSPSADRVLDELRQELAGGVTRIAMSRHIGAGDIHAVRHVTQRATEIGAQVVHGHGAKGGAYARLATAPAGAIRVYTPHGGSLHYSRTTPVGFLYLTLESVLRRRTDLFLFESAYGREAFTQKVGAPTGLVQVAHNGVSEAEFEPVELSGDACDVLFIGELRMLKGVDVLLEALALIRARTGKAPTAVIVGAGPDANAFKAQAEALGLADSTLFPGALPARQAFALGRVMTVPSRAESLPYIVLEAAAAGLPLVTTKVGGIGEIFGDHADRLIPPGDVPALAGAIQSTLDDPFAASRQALELRKRIRQHFSIETMVNTITIAYSLALSRKAK